MSSEEHVPDGLKLYKQIKAIREGAATAWPKALPTLTIGQQNVDQAQFDQLCAKMIAPFQAAIDTFAAWQSSLKARDTAIPLAQAFVQGVYGVLPQALGPESPDLVKYGKPPKKPRKPLTSEQKVIAAEKAKATRKARGTLSKKAKSQIHGTLPPEITLPTTPPGTPPATPPSTPPPAPVPPVIVPPKTGM